MIYEIMIMNTLLVVLTIIHIVYNYFLNYIYLKDGTLFFLQINMIIFSFI